MTKPFDPYEELKVPRDATTEDIRKAYRRRAKKTHPDKKGGDAEAFMRASRALVVLTDPGQRAQFDRDGTISDAQPDNGRAAALGIINNHLVGILNGYIRSGFKAEHDPRKMKVLEMLDEAVANEVIQHTFGRDTGRKVAKFYEDMVNRFECTEAGGGTNDPIGNAMRAHLQQARQTMAALENGIAVRELARQILKTYRYRTDNMTKADQLQTWAFGVGASTSGNFT